MKLDKITLKLIKYFVSILSVIIFICFIGSSVFLSQFHKNSQFKLLKSSAEEIYSSLKEGYFYEDVSINAIIIKDNKIISLGRKKMGMINSLRHIDFNTLPQQGSFKNMGNQSFLYYKLSTEFGDILTFQNSKYSSEYLKLIYIILLTIFILALVLCIPLISYVGKKFTHPILKLQKTSQEIAGGNFNTKIDINTQDEIEDLAHSLESMATSLQKKYDLQRDFIANVSHDFKTPLSVMRSYSEAIKDGIVSDEEAKSYAEEIINEVDRLNKLVIEIMELSKLQSGKLPLNKEYFNIKDLLNECIDKFKPIANEKNISLVLDANNVEIYGDRHYLLRVIYNFVDNALKFSPKNETVTVCTAFVDKRIKVSVINRGMGISKNMLNNIWNKYYKHTKSGGIGLGLPICSEILNLHNFEYGVISEENKQTEFYFLAQTEKII
ncbi:sensor histidine kinase [Clostridium ganghwense]|uniref:histidine kinase n=1 Tax=Clostridium ganghwense TaxID=312089 RepID=A0ABT4CPP6_9CLOT|nr:HAMP domain-containing sensor histidine kinase [Clostridium ganghwense]MCY6370211.1 HAMP domain-containing sensor histidine kinase [Clostridium ganghwense]